MQINIDDIKRLLMSDDSRENERLFVNADRVRKMHVGDEVHLRGLVEFSNICSKRCAYCGINASRIDIERYSMTDEEILEAASGIIKAGFGTIVLQSGDKGRTKKQISHLIHKIKESCELAVTLSVGEQDADVLREWKKAGADRYLLRFETGDNGLYESIHPDSPLEMRIGMLYELKEMGYETGTGIMVGIPRQTYESIAKDIKIMKDMDIDMVGIGPFIPDPATPLGKIYSEKKYNLIPNDVLTTLKVLSIIRINMPDINIPSTTALATLDENGRTSGLNAGANIIMPNMTPCIYRKLYTIYPGKKAEFSDISPDVLKNRISDYLFSIGRSPGKGYGFRKKVFSI